MVMERSLLKVPPQPGFGARLFAAASAWCSECGWDVTAFTFLVLTWGLTLGSDAQRRAAAEDPGRTLAVGFGLLAVSDVMVSSAQMRHTKLSHALCHSSTTLPFGGRDQSGHRDVC